LSGVAHAGPDDVTRDPGSVSRENQTPKIEAVDSSTDHGTRDTGHAPSNTDHSPQTLVLPSVPVDQLLDDHAVEFEECKRWANSEAGQAAKMTNPAGFANVRAHTEAHLRAMSLAANANPAVANAAPAKGKPSPAPKPKES
jgi:hypothetical protein